MSAEPRMIRTEAEEAIIARFAADMNSLPGGAEVRAERRAAFERFEKTGLPTRRVEEWKYTDLRTMMRKVAAAASRPSLEDAERALKDTADTLPGLTRHRLVLVDGFYFGELSDHAALADAGVRVEPVAALLARDGAEAVSLLGAEGKARNDIALSLNASFVTDGVSLSIPDGKMLGTPIEVLHISTSAVSTASRSHFSIGADASVRVIESHVGPSGIAYQTNASVRIDVGSKALVAYAKLQADGDAAVHLGSTTINAGPQSEVSHLTVTAGAAVSRSQIFLATGGDHTRVSLNGAAMLKGKQHADATLVIDHALPGANTRVLYKTVVDDDARGVFQGRINVWQVAQKTDAKMMSQALLISEAAEFDSKPELEIFADDVQCGHGSTAGQIEESQLFYLMARGVPRADAEQLLIEAFLDSAIEELGDEAIGEALKIGVAGWLARRGTNAP